MPDSTLSTLEQIRVKIRRVAKSPSTSQITNDQIDDYINTFVLYDLPAHLKLDALHESLVFYTEPNVDTYATNTVDPDDPLYNFKNRYSTIHGPVYIAGDESYLCFSDKEFYDIYPKSQLKINIGTGDGVTTNFTGTLDDYPVLQESVSVSSINTAGDSLRAHDDGDGVFTGDVAVPGTFTYLTGAYDITFSTAPANEETVWMQTYPYTAGKPDTILLKNNEFKLRQVPDCAYKIEVQAFVRPTELLLDGDLPELAQWAQYIALGACRTIFLDRSDFDSLGRIEAEFKNQETLINRKVITQNSSKRAATIYDM